MTTLPARPRDIAALDVPVAQVEADALRKLAARLDPELRHQMFDLDPDSTCRLPGATCPACPPRNGGDGRG